MKHFHHPIPNIRAIYLFALLTYPVRGFIAWLLFRLLTLRHKKLILIFGLSRSGTTMLGQFLSFPDSVKYVHEPVKQIFQAKYKKQEKNPEFWKLIVQPKYQKFKIHSLMTVCFLNVLGSSGKTRTICLKEVAMSDALQNIHLNHRSVSVFYISRHPCGRIESNIRSQKLHLQQGQAFPDFKYTGMARYWAGNIAVAKQVVAAQSNWYWIYFEEMTNNPLEKFKTLYQQLQLPWTEEILAWIHGQTTGDEGNFYQTKRDASTQADKWKDALSPEQIELIRENTRKFNTGIYDGF